MFAPGTTGNDGPVPGADLAETVAETVAGGETGGEAVTLDVVVVMER